jgi:hypothetical protein
MTLSITARIYYAESHYAECHELFIVMLNVIILSVEAPFKAAGKRSSLLKLRSKKFL